MTEPHRTRPDFEKYSYRPSVAKLFRLQPAHALAWVETDSTTTATRFHFA